jgi:signal transduction histidine kinase
LTSNESDFVKCKEYARVLLQTTEDLAGHVEELMAAYFEAHQTLITVNLENTVQKIIHQLQPPDDVTIEVFNHCISPFKCHESKLFSLLQNLISNSIKHRDIKKSRCLIQVQFDQVDNGIVITVSDNGPGIPVELQQKIFQVGSRANSTATGHGLGLFIVKSIVTELCGKISIESTTEGSTFYIKLPNAGVENIT